MITLRWDFFGRMEVEMHFPEVEDIKPLLLTEAHDLLHHFVIEQEQLKKHLSIGSSPLYCEEMPLWSDFTPTHHLIAEAIMEWNRTHNPDRQPRLYIAGRE